MRHALRAIARMPGLAAVVILSIGVGIGVNTTVFSWLQAMVLKPLPGVPGGGGFYSVEPRAPTGTYPGVSWLEYHDLQERLSAIPELIAFRPAPLNVGEASRTERTFALLVSGNYFAGLQLRPALGRFIGPDEVRLPGGDPVVVVSHGYWESRLNADPNAVGQTLRVNDRLLTVVGVAPDGFQGTVLGLQFDLWVPATLAPALLAGSRELEERGQRGYMTIGRLRAGATAAQAQAELAAALGDLAVRFPQTNAGVTGEVMTFWRAPRGPQRMITTAIGMLQGLMLLVLLAVCGNTANLVLARASSRQREVGIRLALGAGPSGVVRLVLAENVLLALFGAALGIVIAVWGTNALRAMPPYGALPIRFQTSVDAAGLGFALLLGVVSGLIFGAAPALQMARLDPQSALRTGSKTAGRSLMRDGLMGVQVALALLVLVVAGLFFKGFTDTRGADVGFKADGVLLAAYDLTGRSANDGLARTFAARLLGRLREIPGVEGAAVASGVPLDIHGLPTRGFTLEGRARTSEAPDQAVINTVTPGYFAVMGIPLLAGSDFVDLSDTATAPQVIVNQEFVRRFINGVEPLGRRLESRGRTYTIAGVVKTSTYDAFGEPPTPAFYFSYRDRPSTLGEIHLRVKPGTEAVLGSDVQRAVHDLDPTLPVYNMRTLTDHIDRNLILRKIPARMFVVVAPVLIALVAIGIYAVVAFSVAHRTAEIGVRLALGATAPRVVRTIVRESMRAIAVGGFGGWIVALLIELHLFRGGRADVPVMILVPLLLAGVAMLSCWLPARRATTVDPVVALRTE